MIFNVTGGGGAALNFKVVGGTSQPANPKENTIWINTSTPITDWVFSATQPTSASGKVWIHIGTSSVVEFNALKKNGIQVYPLSAKQYVDRAWKNVTAKSYQGGKWVDWITYLFKSGEGTRVSFKQARESSATIDVNNTRIAGTSNGTNGAAWLYLTEEKHSLNGKSKVVFKAKCTYRINGDEWGLRFVICDNVPSYVSQSGLGTVYGTAYLTANSTTQEYTIPASNLNNEYRIGCFGIGSVEIYDIYME